jgi:hypothetical protein
MAKPSFNRKKTLLTNKFDLNLRTKLVKCYVWGRALYDAGILELQKVDHKYLQGLKWRSAGPMCEK